MRPGRIGIRRPKVALKVVLASALLSAALSQPAAAQLGLFGQSEASPQQVYETIAAHGFRMVGPLFRNGQVYVADVLDRGHRRERLIIAAENGQIVQRFFVDVGTPGRDRSYAMRTPDDSGPRRLPRDEQDNSFFSRLTRGWNDDPPPRPPLGLDDQDDGAATMPRAVPPPRLPRPRPEPRVVTRTEQAPVTASPLPPPAAVARPAEKAALPASATNEAAPPASNGRPTTIVLDPLRIPGQRAPAPKATPAPTAVVATKPADLGPGSTAKPVPPKASSPDVPVAPLD